jgi:glutamine amidotransferase
MIAIVDYNAGNLTSVKLALDHIGADSKITQNREEILGAERVVFPGVGAIGSAMGHLLDLELTDVIREVAASGTPFLGICLGTQIILDRSEEDGQVDGLGIIPGTARLFRPRFPHDKVPQIGWNSVVMQSKHPIFDGIRDGSEFYFIHSYYPEPLIDNNVLGVTDYSDVTFASVVGRDNIVATQFHPERSGQIGLKLLTNFVNWKVS